MRAASWPRARADERLLVVDTLAEALTEAASSTLPEFFSRGDVLVVNDAATLPASLHARFFGEPIELRLASLESDERFMAAVFGADDWRTPTERRPPPPMLTVGDVMTFDPALSAEVLGVDPRSPRLVRIAFNQTDAALWSALYRLGRPVQYAYIDRPLELWHVQNSYAARPFAVEQPSAGRPLSFSILAQLQRRGVAVLPLTHAAGLSSIGDPDLDAALPLPERFILPEETAAGVSAASGRVIAAGTSVARALEGAWLAGGGRLCAGEGITNLRIGPEFQPRVVSGLLTGIHPRGTSHAELVRAWLPAALFERALERAETHDYLCHEFGDSMLVLS